VRFKNHVSSLYEPTENELQGSGVAISKNANRVLNSENRLPSNPNAEVEFEDRYELHTNLDLIVAHVHGFQTSII
jgi:hypothetical protein